MTFYTTCQIDQTEPANFRLVKMAGSDAESLTDLNGYILGKFSYVDRHGKPQLKVTVNMDNVREIAAQDCDDEIKAMALLLMEAYSLGKKNRWKLTRKPLSEALKRSSHHFRYWAYRRKIGNPIPLTKTIGLWWKRFSREWFN